MKRLLLITMLFMAPTSAFANDDQILFLIALSFVDYNQSVDIFLVQKTGRELNPLLGATPTRKELALAGITGIGLVYCLKQMNAPKWFVDSIIVSERMNIDDNQRIRHGFRRHIRAIPVVLALKW